MIVFYNQEKENLNNLVGENEGSEQNPWMSQRAMSDELREVEILGKTCCGDGDWF